MYKNWFVFQTYVLCAYVCAHVLQATFDSRIAKIAADLESERVERDAGVKKLTEMYRQGLQQQAGNSDFAAHHRTRLSALHLAEKEDETQHVE